MDKKFEEYVAQAELYKQIGQVHIRLFTDSDDECPWEHATGVEDGASYRLGLRMSTGFYAEHPCGLTFGWLFDIETPEANGSSQYHIDTQRIQRIVERIKNQSVKDQFLGYLKEVESAVRAKGAELQEITDKQFEVADVIASLLRPINAMSEPC